MFSPDYERRLFPRTPIRDEHDSSQIVISATNSAGYTTPLTSPNKLSARDVTSPTLYSSDRFVPIRNNDSWQLSYRSATDRVLTKSSQENEVAYSCLLQNELLETSIDDVKVVCDGRMTFKQHHKRNLFGYSPKKSENVSPSVKVDPSPYSVSPVSSASEKLLTSPRKAKRTVSGVPIKILDAPELQDDFYLNLVDWSSQDIVGVGLGSCVFLWNAATSQVTKLCDFSMDGNNAITSVAWNTKGDLLAVGSRLGYVQVWDVTANKRVNTLQGHSGRVGTLAWDENILSSGSRDRSILQRDIRTPALVPVRKLAAHHQEVCGLKYSLDYKYLASGGNDNRLYVWNSHSISPIQTYTEHSAAVKAIAWSPHHQGLLASGGGTTDCCIRFWNTLTGQCIQCIDTGSQLCNLLWSKHTSEFVSTHGYSEKQIAVWKYPCLTKVAKLTGHSRRVLYSAMSPNGEVIVTGSGDETLRLWKVFDGHRLPKKAESVLNLFTLIR